MTMITPLQKTYLVLDLGIRLFQNVNSDDGATKKKMKIKKDTYLVMFIDHSRVYRPYQKKKKKGSRAGAPGGAPVQVPQIR